MASVDVNVKKLWEFMCRDYINAIAVYTYVYNLYLDYRTANFTQTLSWLGVDTFRASEIYKILASKFDALLRNLNSSGENKLIELIRSALEYHNS